MESLDRFVAAQQQVYPRVIAELRAGAKQSHWMWFIFPQIEGLGYSAMAQRYAIHDIAEAWSYLAHPVLGPRLAECTNAVLNWAGRRSLQTIMGATDTMKFRSSMTLFEAAGGTDHFGKAIDRFFAGERDWETLSILASIEA